MDLSDLQVSSTKIHTDSMMSRLVQFHIFSKIRAKICQNSGRGSTLSKASRSKLGIQKWQIFLYQRLCHLIMQQGPKVGGCIQQCINLGKILSKYFQFCRIYQKQGFAANSCQNISSSVGFTKKVDSSTFHRNFLYYGIQKFLQ